MKSVYSILVVVAVACAAGSLATIRSTIYSNLPCPTCVYGSVESTAVDFTFYSNSSAVNTKTSFADGEHTSNADTFSTGTATTVLLVDHITNTIIATFTHCSENACSVATEVQAVTVVTTTVNGEKTIYTTYYPESHTSTVVNPDTVTISQHSDNTLPQVIPTSEASDTSIATVQVLDAQYSTVPITLSIKVTNKASMLASTSTWISTLASTSTWISTLASALAFEGMAAEHKLTGFGFVMGLIAMCIL